MTRKIFSSILSVSVIVLLLCLISISGILYGYFGNVIKKELRTEAGFTQSELAEMVGNCTDNISRLERNKFKNPTYQLLYDIAEFFEKPVEEIFWYEEI